MEIKDESRGEGDITNVIIEEIKSCLTNFDGDLIDKLKCAMKIAKNHLLLTGKGSQFKCPIAIAGIMLHYGKESEECKRLEWEFNQLKKLYIAIEAQRLGVQTSLDFLLENQTEYKPIGLIKLWEEVK